jgi:hypothetical protein
LSNSTPTTPKAACNALSQDSTVSFDINLEKYSNMISFTCYKPPNLLHPPHHFNQTYPKRNRFHAIPVMIPANLLQNIYQKLAVFQTVDYRVHGVHNITAVGVELLTGGQVLKWNISEGEVLMLFRIFLKQTKMSRLSLRKVKPATYKMTIFTPHPVRSFLRGAQEDCTRYMSREVSLVTGSGSSVLLM